MIRVGCVLSPADSADSASAIVFDGTPLSSPTLIVECSDDHWPPAVDTTRVQAPKTVLVSKQASLYSSRLRNLAAMAASTAARSVFHRVPLEVSKQVNQQVSLQYGSLTTGQRLSKQRNVFSLRIFRRLESGRQPSGKIDWTRSEVLAEDYVLQRSASGSVVVTPDMEWQWVFKAHLESRWERRTIPQPKRGDTTGVHRPTRRDRVGLEVADR